MKKIIALVLSLVMALSLCTVAFGVNDPTTGKKIYDYSDTTKEFTNPCDVKFVDGKVFADGSGIVTHYVKVDGASTFYYVPCDKDDAATVYGIFNNGAQVCWVKYAGEGATGDAATKYEFKATVQKATETLPNCTTAQYLVDGYLDANGKFWVKDETSTTVALVNGILVNVKEAEEGLQMDVIYASHIFAKGVENTKTGYDVATCLICKGEFACTNDNLVATKNGYKISTGFEYCDDCAWNVYNANAYDNGYDFAWGQQYSGSYKFCWQLKAGTTEEIGTADKADTTTGVESAKTFDAGIAMYVGMSLMSVAGTAVVIGKKKEF